MIDKINHTYSYQIKKRGLVFVEKISATVVQIILRLTVKTVVTKLKLQGKMNGISKKLLN